MSAWNEKVVIGIVAFTAAAIITCSIIIIIFLRRNFKPPQAAAPDHFTEEFGHKLKGLIVHEEENWHQFLYFNDLQLNEDDDELKGDFTIIKRPKISKHRDITSDKESNEHSKVPVPETTKAPPPPPPPPLMPKKSSLPPPPPPPPMGGGLLSSNRPPRSTIISKTKAAHGSTPKDTTSFSQRKKLKPLHWDKLIANADHSLVWNDILDGSLRFDDDQIELLFGYKHANTRRSPQGNAVLSSTSPSRAQVFILEPRKSQNTAIVLKSIAISRDEILDSLLEGHGLSTDLLEKLTRIAPTEEEQLKILQFRGDPSSLANAEGFLYHILKALPSAFVRANAMLFRSNYNAEILQFKESLQTLELGCKELRTPRGGMFLKLLEAILKAGNRMNAGTSRGNAQGFNLTTLRKLSDVKSIDGKTTLLHFVVEQVARSEGRHALLLKRNFQSPLIDEQQECLPLGLQALEGLSSQMSNVKKAANIDFDCFINTFSSLTTHVQDIQMLIANYNNGEGGNFVREMKTFLDECQEELKVVQEEQARILEFVKRTTKYYQAGASNFKQERSSSSSSLQLFLIVKDFLDMVDKVCINISKNIKNKNVAAKSLESRSVQLPQLIKSSVRFPDLVHLTLDSESDNDFST